MATCEFYKLRVMKTQTPIRSAKSLLFDIPDALKEVFRWQAGQRVTLRFVLNGKEVRRSYNISSSPVSGGPLRITVKRVPDGLVSNYINDHIKAGAEVDVMPPFGRFCLDTIDWERRTHYFFGAGSGITPLFAMLHTVLLAEPYSYVYLIYGNTGEKSIIFREKLDMLSIKYAGRFIVRHVLSKQSWLSSYEPWHRGKIDADLVQSFLAQNPPLAHDTQYYVCGPGNMNAVVRAALRKLDVPQDRIHSESFGRPVDMDDAFVGIGAKAEVGAGVKTAVLPITP